MAIGQIGQSTRITNPGEADIAVPTFGAGTAQAISSMAGVLENPSNLE
jgi:hypothetical protein